MEKEVDDIYYTISEPVEAVFTEKRSKFLGFAFPVSTVEEVKDHLAELQKKYYDARHLCYAYMLGFDRSTYRANDNGEPSGTAGKPILGQLNHFNLTNVLVVVVRYFGGIKLGTGGLIVAYRTVSRILLEEAEILECTIQESITVSYAYPLMNEVMRVVKEEMPQVTKQQFEIDCLLVMSIRASRMPILRKRFEDLRDVIIVEK
ncbi:MAG: YigZ family protein [Bacteroidaceae bacterium]